MGDKSNSSSAAPLKKQMKFTPKVPHKKPKPAKTKMEPPEENAIIDSKLLRLVKQSHAGSEKRTPKIQRKLEPANFAFGCGDQSTSARSFDSPTHGVDGNKHQDDSDVSVPISKKEHLEPWDYNSYYPTPLPLRRPNSGNPDILDEVEFEKASASSTQDETCIKPAEELGLLEKNKEPRMLFFQLPASLPLAKRSAVSVLEKGCSLQELPAGFMGKMLVYKSGIVKMKLGDVLFDVSPGIDCVFPQDVAAINTREKQCCILGNIDKRATVTLDVDSLLDALNDSD